MIRRVCDAEAAPPGQPPAPVGQVVRPIDAVSRPPVSARNARTELDQYKLSLRKYAPADRGLPWHCQARCARCRENVPARFVLDETDGSVQLEYDCPTCGPWRERHCDAIFSNAAGKQAPGRRGRQPASTLSGSPLRSPIAGLPRTVETLCPECACVILGRSYAEDGQVYMEKTCPEHGYFRDRLSSDLALYRKGAMGVFQDERGPARPQVRGGSHCPTDCGLCAQHLSCSCLAQIDLTNRCNLTCPICFANANAAGHVAEPDYAMIVEMLRALRAQRPYPATAVQFTGGEPTVHPDFHRILATARDMGFSHIQIATNGITHADPEFARRSADAGLHTLYLQFDGVEDAFYRRFRGQPLLEQKLACIENCRRAGLKVVLVPTIVRTINDDQVGPIFRFAVEHVNAVSAISYQPVAFTGRISRREVAQQRYTLGDLAHDLAAVSGADLERDFWPLGILSPLSRIMECLDGKTKIRSSCHADCAFGTYFFVTPQRQAVPIPSLFDMYRMMADFNAQAGRIQARGRSADEIVRANPRELARIAYTFFKHYRWRRFFDADVKPWTFIRALRGLTDKRLGRGDGEKRSYKTLMAAGMHFMDRYNYDTERVRRCVIQYSTPDGIYPFCTINGGPEYRPFIERMVVRDAERRSPAAAPSPLDAGVR